MTAGSRSWWAAKVRQFRTHVRARVEPDERRALEAWTTDAERALFDSMHVADRRHGLDVAGTLREQGIEDRDALVAGLLHDAGKGDTGVLPRIVHSLAQAYGGWVAVPARLVPGMGTALERLRTHAEASAQLAAAAGCSPRTVELIRWQEAPRDPEFGERLRLADEAN
ncbi:MAG TPA: hypothetical protein VFX65_05365 [Candidatus Limnocylindrales bacterium]|nr:hypothetical protein [Candidatus Limnocylindrales bacterium]